MRKVFIDRIGNRYGRLLVISLHKKDNSNTSWLCQCDCGNTKVITGSSLVTGSTKSCGCLRKEITSKKAKTHGEGRKGHESTEYISWLCMKQRCLNKTNKDYKTYGAVGITVCDRWANSYELFLQDMGRKPHPKWTIDRYPNKTGNYEPGNCRWADDFQQAGNKSNNVWFEHNGVKMIMQDWCNYFGIGNRAIYGMMKRGKTFKEVHEYYSNKKLKNDSN